jgi:hypothetical protein
MYDLPRLATLAGSRGVLELLVRWRWDALEAIPLARALARAWAPWAAAPSLRPDRDADAARTAGAARIRRLRNTGIRLSPPTSTTTRPTSIGAISLAPVVRRAQPSRAGAS